LDPNTAITIMAAHLIMSGGLLGLIAHRRRMHVELRDWSLGALCFGLAFAGRVATGLGSIGALPLASDLLLVLGALVIGRGMARMGGYRVPPALIAGPFLAFAVAHGVITWEFGSFGRFVFLNATLGALYLVVFQVSWNAPSAMPKHQARLALPVKIFGFVLLLLAVASLARTLHVAFHGTAVLYAGVAAVAYFVASSVFVTMLELLLLWIVFERLSMQLEDMAARDPLTQLLNRAGLTAAVADHFETSPRVPLAALLVDIDHFKNINDAYGHAVGDSVLRAVVGDGLRRICRATDIVARVGGEEFAVLCRSDAPQDAAALAERLRQGIAALRIPVGGDGQSVQCTVSIGVSQPFDGPHAWEAANVQADRAMYRAKAAGRNRVQIADRPDNAAGLPSSMRPDPVAG
jgi:diguanylate cyclase (GGDEF)-like protein